MPPWKQRAEEIFPELVSQFEEADTPYMLWFELRNVFEEAYEQSPPDESLIRRIYQYSDWCVNQPRGLTAEDDLLTCVAVCFYEHIPQHQAARKDMPRWWRVEDMSEESIFRYHLSDEEFRELRSFLARQSHQYDSSLRTVSYQGGAGNWPPPL
jgi:hypothetical protein